MFQNVLMTSLTPLRNTDEINCWQNRPFTTIWPEDTTSSKYVHRQKSPEVTKTIKKRTKRVRTAYTTDQLQVLEKTYHRIKYIDARKRRDLAETLNISEKSIKVWFQNRRMKEKKESSESSDSSVEVSTTERSSPYPQPTVTPTQDAQILLNEYGQFPAGHECTNSSEYQLPNFNFYNHAEYLNQGTTILPPSESFTDDKNTHPTLYYPTLQDYYFGENYQYDVGINVNYTEWSANNFDLNYFQ